MLLLGGLGDAPPKKILEARSSRISSCVYVLSVFLIIACTFSLGDGAEHLPELVHKRMSIFNLRRFAYNIQRFIECFPQHKVL